MTRAFTHAVVALSTRFLSDRAFELIVLPALADLDFDRERHPGMVPVRSSLAVVAAVMGALYDEAIRDTQALLTFTGLVCLPAAYYSFLLVVCLPTSLQSAMTPGNVLLLGAAILLASIGPAVVCYWPERREPSSRETP